MSHTVTRKSSITNLQLLIKTCKALGLTHQQGDHMVRLYERAVQADFSFKPVGWSYPVAVDLKTGELKYDNFNGCWGKDEELHIVQQEYHLQLAEEQLSQYTLEGWTLERVKQEDGLMQVVAVEP